jgi:hypothetical protein
MDRSTKIIIGLALLGLLLMLISLGHDFFSKSKIPQSSPQSSISQAHIGTVTDNVYL